MRKTLPLRLIVFLIYFIVIVLLKRWFNVDGLIFLFGGLLGFIFPFFEYIIYIYFLEPESAFSKETKSVLKPQNFIAVSNEMYINGNLRKKFIIHTWYFYALILLLSIYVITSSGSYFGRGLILGFAITLSGIQIEDYLKLGTLNNWLSEPLKFFDKERQLWYLIGNLLFLFILALMK